MDRDTEILQHTIEYRYEKDQEMSDHEKEHVKNMIIEGFSSGQLIDIDHESEGENAGWWTISK